MKRRQQLTGFDYLAVSAHEAVQAGMPFADDFQTLLMATQTWVPTAPDEAKQALEADLDWWEMVPVSVVGAAMGKALERRDVAGLVEVVKFLPLLPRFPHYLRALEKP